MGFGAHFFIFWAMGFIEEEITGEAARIALPILESLGMELVDMEYRRESNGWVLRLYIDKEGGVNLDDCGNVSREVGLAIEVADVIDHPYNLEVSSPGLTRPLKKEADFERFKGKAAKIKCFAPIDGKKVFTGILGGIENDTVTLTANGKPVEITFKNIAKANLEFMQED